MARSGSTTSTLATLPFSWEFLLYFQRITTLVPPPLCLTADETPITGLSSSWLTHTQLLTPLHWPPEMALCCFSPPPSPFRQFFGTDKPRMVRPTTLTPSSPHDQSIGPNHVGCRRQRPPHSWHQYPYFQPISRLAASQSSSAITPDAIVVTSPIFFGSGSHWLPIVGFFLHRWPVMPIYPCPRPPACLCPCFLLPRSPAKPV